MGPLHTCPWGWGQTASLRPVLLSCPSVYAPPESIAAHTIPAQQLATQPLPTRRDPPSQPLRASPDPQIPRHHPGPNGEWGQDSTARHRDVPWVSPCPAHPGGGLPRTSHPLPKGRGHCPAASPTPWEASTWLSHPPPQNGQALAQGGDPPVLRTCLHRPSWGQPRPEAWKAALPQEPKKVSSGHWGAGLGHEACAGAAQQLNLRPGAETGAASRWRCAACNRADRRALPAPQTSPVLPAPTPAQRSAAARAASQHLETGGRGPWLTCDSDDGPLRRVQDAAIARRAGPAAPAPLRLAQVPRQGVPGAGGAAASVGGAILGRRPHLKVFPRHGLRERERRGSHRGDCTLTQHLLNLDTGPPHPPGHLDTDPPPVSHLITH